MRVLPQPHRGLHPAYPDWTEGSLRNRLGILDFLLIAGGLALPFLFRRRQPLATTIKAAAYIGSGTMLCVTGLHYVSCRTARTFLEKQGIEVPDGKIVDRVGCFDSDDAVLSGGIAAMLVSFASRKPPKVLGWKRYVGTFTLGGTLGATLWYGLMWYRLGFHRFAQIAAHDGELVKEAEKCKSVINSSPPHSGIGGLAALRLPLRGTSNDRPSGAQVSLGQPGAGQQAEILKDGPHISVQIPGEREPVPRPQTNYEWSSDHEIEDLEKHIAKLRERRQRVAQESEWLWAWLSEKEAEYYNSADSKSDTPNRKEMLRYLDLLSAGQRLTWSEVSMVDWMIADSQKRLNQGRSASDNQGQVTWRASTTTQTVPEVALTGARNGIRELDGVENQLRQAKTAMAIEMADPDFDMKEDNQVYHPVKQKTVSEKEMFLEAREALDKQLEEFALQRKILGLIIEDSQKRTQ
ncbi:hypothetical protein M409DRAFT_52340 [Zasmidium cellare ATCC 36951]|uniref:Uncharacterized protein n=1 Tax=Zasmidium cellare ATCC 36951 TaxID=1080233 RepID=A0A6A6CUI9_ZASCE|nr:uncharacterized protein M409DRAFT_52340 [Zasmidium cellare ATCC 36951]KAF2169848.1 hypothetical protein M409DRAFT_52340 [Zasmidium cellare ATCC 36951]